MNGSLEIKIILRNRKPEQADDPRKNLKTVKRMYLKERPNPDGFMESPSISALK